MTATMIQKAKNLVITCHLKPCSKNCFKKRKRAPKFDEPFGWDKEVLSEILIDMCHILQVS